MHSISCRFVLFHYTFSQIELALLPVIFNRLVCSIFLKIVTVSNTTENVFELSPTYLLPPLWGYFLEVSFSS